MGLEMNFESRNDPFIDIRYMKFDSPNKFHGFHIHDEYELIYVIDGIGYVFIEGNLQTYSKGDVILTKGSELHAPLSDALCIRILFDSAEIRSMSPKENDLLDIFDKRPRGFYNIVRGSCDEADLIMRSAEDMLGLSYKSCQRNDSGLLKSFLDLLRLLGKLYGSYRERSFQSIYSPHLREIIDHININFDKDLRLCTICSEFYISPQHLNRLFKKISGGSVHDYIVSRRLIRSKELLKSGHSVSESCSMSGFKDYSNFIRLFKAKTGMSPGKYARRYDH